VNFSTFSHLLRTSCALLLATSAFAAPPSDSYQQIKKIPLGAAPGGGEYFDYIYMDAAARRVYATHGTEIKVVDADAGSVVGTITGFKRCHGVAIVRELGKGFVTDGATGEVDIFNLDSLKVTGKVKASPDADYILFDPASKHIFAFAGDSKNVTVIDPEKETVIGTIALGAGPEQAVADGQGMIYNNLEDANEVVAIDSRTLRIANRWPVAPSGHPVSIAMDREHRRLFIGGRDPKILVVMDADTGKVLQSFPIGDRVDSNVFDPKTGIVASSTREGTLHLFHEDSPDKFSVIETIKTEFGAKTMALDPNTHNLYVDTSDFAPGSVTAAHPTATPGTFHLLIYGH
jgi:YVTN family beta-propeller protein